MNMRDSMAFSAVLLAVGSLFFVLFGGVSLFNGVICGSLFLMSVVCSALNYDRVWSDEKAEGY